MKIISIMQSACIGCSLILLACNKGGDTSANSPTTASLTTVSVSAITQTTATSGGNISSDGGASVTARGVCWGTSANPSISGNKTVDGAGTGSFTSSITGLSANTTYHLRAYATNSIGTAYGADFTFTTSGSSGTVTDIDGNIYRTVAIGGQTWMAEDLKVTKYRNGDVIPNVTDGLLWAALTTGAYCDYDNSPSNTQTYGRLYNWFAVHDPRNIAPAGWHVASDDEWATLENYLGQSDAANKLREAGTGHWLSPNAGTNSTGFTALPGGSRADLGIFNNTSPSIGKYIEWWCRNSTARNYRRIMNYSTPSNVANAVYIGGNHDKAYGKFVRCVKD